MPEKKGTVEALPREEVPEDLSTLKWAVLQKTAKRTLGINPRQKRPMLELAVNAALGRETLPPAELVAEATPEPEPSPAEASPVERIEAEMADMHPEPADKPPARPQVSVEKLPDLTKGERPLEEAPAAPAPTPTAEPATPPVDGLPPVAAPQVAKAEEKGKFPKPPVLYYSKIAKLNIIVSVGKAGYYDQDRIWQDPIAGTSCHFGVMPNQSYTFKATDAWQIEAIETSDKFQHGLVWRAEDEAKAALAQARGTVAALEAKLEGLDSASIQQRRDAAMGKVAVVQGPRHTRSTAPAAIPAENAPPWEGIDALLNSRGRLGAAARDGLRHAEARGEI